MCRLHALRIFQAKREDGDARSYVVTIDRAWGLAKADRFGKADPMVSIKVGQLDSSLHVTKCIYCMRAFRFRISGALLRV